jgi:hypothetical protein
MHKKPDKGAALSESRYGCKHSFVYISGGYAIAAKQIHINGAHQILPCVLNSRRNMLDFIWRVVGFGFGAHCQRCS